MSSSQNEFGSAPGAQKLLPPPSYAENAETQPLLGGAQKKFSPDCEDEEERKSESVPENSYSGTVVLMMKDLHRIAYGTKYLGVRVFRVLFAMMNLWMLMGIQIFLLVQIKIFVTSPAVGEIRETYDHYEKVMYDGHVKKTPFPFHLGIGGPDGKYFNPKNFDKLKEAEQEAICQVPFSQPYFLGAILFIWALTVFGEIKSAFKQMYFIYSLKRSELHESIRENVHGSRADIVVGQPLWTKVFICVTMIIPRILIAFILLWLGCRWLAATIEFSEVLINGVALEFILKLNELLYDKLMSDRNKREVRDTEMDVSYEGRVGPSVSEYLSTFAWAIISFLWVWCYMFRWQKVLPGYNWDVKAVCAPWIAERFSFWKI